jgi:tetratricopeptide (TPR) repeat protein
MLQSQWEADQLTARGADHHRAGDLRSADALYASALTRNPRHAEAWHLRGLVAHQSGDPTTAVACVEQAVAIDPQQAVYWSNLGLFYQALRRLDQAIAAFRQAIRLQPDLAEARANLGNALNEKHDFQGAEAECRCALRLRPDLSAAYNNLGVALTGQERTAEAIACYRRAVELRPNSADAHRNLGHALRELGQFDEARREYETVVALNPRETHALYSLSLIKRHRPSEPQDLQRLTARLQDPLLSLSERAELSFALGRVYDDWGRYDEAFEHFQWANKAVRPAWDRLACAHSVEALIDAFCADRVAALPPAGLATEQPVFIVGMPRSGTTLVEQILAASPRVAACGEVMDLQQMTLELEAEAAPDTPWPRCVLSLPPERLRELAQRYLDRRLARQPDALRTTDKMPTNFFQLGLIWRLFPHARVIHCQRDPRDVCLSCYFIDFSKRLEFAYDLEDLGTFHRLHDRIMAHWKRVLPLSILTVQYERLVAEPEQETRRIVDFCGLDWDERHLRFYENHNSVRTSSGWQVRQPVYATAVARWRNYERHLEPLLRALAEN